MKIVTVVGARPQFVKAWAVTNALTQAGVDEVLVHTGQHYDEELSGRFFSELGLSPPTHNLGIGSGPHGQQTGRMLEGVERILEAERPDWVIVYGDTNSTVAGALAAVKLHVPLAHIEAGLRSYSREMPEEINRVLTDHMSSLLFCPSDPARENLAREGIGRGVHVIGDVMLDALQHFSVVARARSTIVQQLGHSAGNYHVATLHRAELTNDPQRLRALLDTLSDLDRPVVLPLHPRTRAILNHHGIPAPTTGHLRLIEPLGYLDMLHLVASCSHVLTDSGGLQKEAYWLQRPCLTLRNETEWTETVSAGWNTLVGTERQAIRRGLTAPVPTHCPELYGDGHAAERIVRAITSQAG